MRFPAISPALRGRHSARHRPPLSTEEAVLVLQKHSRGWRTRTRGLFASAFDGIASGMGASTCASSVDAVQLTNAAHLFPAHGREERTVLMVQLWARLDALTTVDWSEPRAAGVTASRAITADFYESLPSDDDQVKIDVDTLLTGESPRAQGALTEINMDSALTGESPRAQGTPTARSRMSQSDDPAILTVKATPTRPSAKPPSMAFLTRARKYGTKPSRALPLDHEEQVAEQVTIIQARVRGNLARAHVREDETPVQCWRLDAWRICLVAPLALVVLLFVSPWLLPLCMLSYAYLRFPYFLGWAASECITRFAMFGYPIRFGAIHMSPWLRLDRGKSPTLKIRLLVEDFALSNPPSMRCLNEDFVSVGQTNVVISVKLGFIRQLIGTGKMRPVTIHFESCTFERARLVFELKRGRLNINGLVGELAEREVKAALPGRVGAALRCLPRSRCKMPNLLRLKFFNVRGRIKRSDMPYIVVRARDTRLATPRGEHVRKHSAEWDEWRFGHELLLRVTDPSTVLDVRVYSSQGRDQLLGRWVMTMKYLVTLPSYCKHKPPLSLASDGSVSGTFFLCDRALHGSAIRSLGPDKLGQGLRGELDMRLQWVHDADLPDLPPPSKTAIVQLNENQAETLLRMGNVSELRALLRRLPIRIRSRVIRLNDVQASIKDIFTGRSGHIETKMEKHPSLSKLLSKEEREAYMQIANTKLEVVKIRRIELSSVSDQDCGSFLQSLFIEQLIPEVLKQTVVGPVGLQTLSQILGGVSVAGKRWFNDLGKELTNLGGKMKSSKNVVLSHRKSALETCPKV